MVSIVSYSRPSLMINASRTQFHVYLPWGQRPFSIVHSVLNVKAIVAAFNQEKALVGAFSVIVKLVVIFAKVRLKLYYLPRIRRRSPTLSLAAPRQPGLHPSPLRRRGADQ